MRDYQAIVATVSKLVSVGADVAVATLRTLLRGAGSMRPEMLQAILTRCAQCSLREDLSGFAARIVSEGTGAAPEPAALAAALVDNPTLSHNVLQSSGEAHVFCSLVNVPLVALI